MLQFILTIVGLLISISQVSADCYEVQYLAAGDGGSENIDFQQNTFLDTGTWTVVNPYLPAFNFFGTLTTGASAYVGYPAAPWTRMNYQVDSTFTQSNQVVIEYWNGATWIAIPVMVMAAATPFNTNAQTFFETLQCESIILGETPGWTAQILNGIGPDYWIRFRILSTLSSDVQLEQTIRYLQEFEVDTFGYTHYTNGVVDRMQLILHSNVSTGLVYLTDFPIFGYNFTKSQDISASTVVRLPSDIDTSKPFKLELSFIATCSGNITWVVSRLVSNTGGMPSLSNEDVSFVITNVTAFQEVRSIIPIYIADIVSRPLIGHPDNLLLGIKRHSSSFSDTCASDIILYAFSARYIKINDGMHVQLF